MRRYCRLDPVDLMRVDLAARSYLDQIVQLYAEVDLITAVMVPGL